MAEKVTLQVELQSKLQQTKDITKKLADSGGFKNNDKALGRVNALLQELESLATKTNPSLKNLSSINALFNELSGILFKIAQATNTASKEFQDLAKQITQTQSSLDKAQGERGSILKKGRINKNTGNYELYKTYQNQVIEQANIKNTKGRSIKTADTFFSKFDNGVAQQGAFQDTQAAQAVYDSLLRTQTENGTRLQELNTAIDNYKAALQKATADLEIQKTKEASPVASQIIQNKIDVNSTIEGQKEAIHQAANEKQETASINDYTKAVNNQSSALGRAFKQFTLYHIAVRSVKKALNEAVKTVQELDKYLTEQAMVTGLTRKQTYELVGSYQQLALQCGATTKEIAQVSTEYMKQGKTIEESLTLTKAAVSAAKVARVSVGDSVNYLTTALNGFRLSAEDAMKVSDKFAAVAASSATDYDELAIALSKVASQANLAGMSIDYTTALLTKGLETTREAPETMGTALKTIIARMRELGDYGETLEDGIALNNVESQLQYVGIELRDQQGELRSTEDVLDELGKKWDTLNKNQQAAIAKALAGTRQQSRLIAMMEDYERVTELQQISARSAGATAAQAGVYLEGMEAAMNKIQVAWEKIVMNFTNSDVIISAFELIGGALDKLGDFLDNTAAQVLVFGSLATVGLVVLGQKLKENELAKEDIRLQNQKLLIENKQNILNLKNEISKKKEIAAEKKIAAAKAKTTLETLKTAKAEAIKNKASKADLAKLDKQIEQQKKVVETSELEAQAAQNDVDMSEHKIRALEEQNLQLDSQLSLTGKLVSMFSSLYGLMLLFKPIYAVILGFQTLINKEKNKEYVATLRQQAAESKGLKKKLMNAGAAMAESAAKIPVAGWIIAAGILAALGIATVSVAIANANKYNKSAEGTSEKINQLSNEIYKLNEKSRAIDNITDSFDTLDNKIIKTNADIKEMGSLLEQAGEKLNNEEVDKKDDVGYGKGKSEQD